MLESYDILFLGWREIAARWFEHVWKIIRRYWIKSIENRLLLSFNVIINMHLIYVVVTCKISLFCHLAIAVNFWKNWIYCIDLFLHYLHDAHYLDSHYHNESHYPRYHLFIAEATEIWAYSLILRSYMLSFLTVRNPIFFTFFGDLFFFIMRNYILIVRYVVNLVFVFLIVFFFEKKSMLVQTYS